MSDWSEWKETRGDYWDTTYRISNPFMPPIRCPDCGEKPVQERGKWINPATYQTQFMCISGHVWSVNKTYD